MKWKVIKINKVRTNSSIVGPVDLLLVQVSRLLQINRCVTSKQKIIRCLSVNGVALRFKRWLLDTNNYVASLHFKISTIISQSRMRKFLLYTIFFFFYHFAIHLYVLFKCLLRIFYFFLSKQSNKIYCDKKAYLQIYYLLKLVQSLHELLPRFIRTSYGTRVFANKSELSCMIKNAAALILTFYVLISRQNIFFFKIIFWRV